MSGPPLGRFEVEKTLGMGGMGRVVLARDPLLGRRVAIKTILSEADERTLLRFAEEAQITGRLAHPNVVPVHELGYSDDFPFLAMRFVEGKDLKSLVGRLASGEPEAREEYSVRRLLRLFLKVCSAVAFAHEQGVIHRDLKPANVMLGRGDEVLVMDWGLAKVTGAGTGGDASSALARPAAGAATTGGLTLDGAIVGTPAYMPPEQTDSSVVLDRTADVYALGAILYELLTHRPPYSGENVKVITALLKGPPPAPRAAAPANEIPAALEAIVLRAMAREPKERYADANELAADVEAFLDDRPVSSHRESAREAIARLVQRHRVALLVVLLATVALLAAGGVVLAFVHAGASAARRKADEANLAQTRADAEAAAAERTDKEARVVARAEAAAGHASRMASDFAVVARTALPVRELLAHRERAGAAIAADVTRLAATIAASEDASAKGALEPALARARAARASVELTLARALCSRQPRTLIALLDDPDEAHRLVPPRDETWLLRARAFLRTDRPDEARETLAGAKFAAKDVEAAARVVRLQLDDAPTEELAPAIDAALSGMPGAGWLHLARAEVLVREGDFVQARAEYSNAQRLDPVDAWSYASMLRHVIPVYGTFEHYPGSVVRFVSLLVDEPVIDPGVPRWYRPSAHPEANVVADLAHARFNLWGYGWLEPFGDNRAFLGHVEDLLVAKLVTPLAAARASAEACLIATNFELAEVHARRAVELAPRDREALGLLAEALVENGKLDEALEVAARGLARHPSDGRLRGARGGVAFRRGAFADAAPDLECAAKCSLDSHRWELSARCLSLLDDPAAWEKGISAIRAGISRDNFDAYFAAARCRPLAGDPKLHRTFGDLRRRQGNHAAAALHYARAWQRAQHPRIVEKFGLDLSDAVRCADEFDALGIREAARVWLQIAQRDPNCQPAIQERMNRWR